MLKKNEGDLNITSADRMVFPNLPLTYEEMILLVPAEIRNPEDKRHRAVYGLIQCMARQLEDARRVSTIQPSQYLRGYERGQSDVQTQFRIRGIQQEMAAVKFRLEINDFRGPAEEEILKNRMLELYELAKRLDPSGVGRFEHRIDKRMKKVRLRENGNYGGNQTGRNERVREVTVKYGADRRGEPDHLYRCQ